MAYTLPNGSTLSIADSYGAAKTMSALTNAAAGVATLEASHGVVVNDILEVTSGWGNLDGRIVRASAVATNDVTFEAIDTSSTTKYPAGGGTGSVREISSWTSITQILDVQTSGGDQQFWTYQPLEGDSQKQVPTVRTPKVFTFTLGDDSSLGWYSVVKAASDAGTPTAFRLSLKNGDILYYNGYVSMDETPSLTLNQGMAISVTLTLVALQTRY